jgi:MFS family permease
MLPATAAMIVVGMSIGRITAAVGSKLPLIAGGFIGGAAFVFLAIAHSQVWQVYVSMALTGAGMGLAFSAMTNLIVDAVPSTHTGVATGMNANIRTVGGAIGSQVVTSVIVAGVAAGALPHERGYVLSFLVLAAGMIAAAVAAMFVPTLRRPVGVTAAAETPAPVAERV